MKEVAERSTQAAEGGFIRRLTPIFADLEGRGLVRPRSASSWVKARLVPVVHDPLIRPPATFSPQTGAKGLKLRGNCARNYPLATAIFRGRGKGEGELAPGGDEDGFIRRWTPIFADSEGRGRALETR